MDLANERTVYFNGRYVPESQALVPYRDRSWLYGDGAFDMTRTFDGRIFRIDEHINRFYRSLRALRLDPGLSAEEMTAISHEVLQRNRHLIPPGEDFWVGQRVSRGVMKVPGDNWDHHGPTVIVECLPMPLAERANLFRDGIKVITPSVRRIPPECLTPRAKSHNYLNLIMGDLEVRAQIPEAWAILLDTNGNLSEGLGSNVFLVRDGEILTPREQFVLPGVSRQTAIDLAAQLSIPLREVDIDLYDAYTCEEGFITSTSLCICPIASVNGVAMPEGAFGPVTQRLIDAYVDLVGCDFVAQYRAKLA
ncbi:MAG: aminotransferase class IV [Pseudomonadota bacterium]